MSWIQEIWDGEAEGELARLYHELRDAGGRVDNIITIHGLHPESLAVHAAFYRLAMRGSAGLSLREREMLAVTVSAVNRCHY